MARNSVLPIPLTQRDSRPRSQVEQDKIESFNAHRRLKLPSVSYSILGPNERVLLRLEEEDPIQDRGQWESASLQLFQKKKTKRRKRHKHPKKPEEKPVKPSIYQAAVSDHLETIFGIPIALEEWSSELGPI